jgi:hypothetical protein
MMFFEVWCFQQSFWFLNLFFALRKLIKCKWCLSFSHLWIWRSKLILLISFSSSSVILKFIQRSNKLNNSKSFYVFLCNLLDIFHKILINDFHINPLQDKWDERKKWLWKMRTNNWFTWTKLLNDIVWNEF